MNSTAESITIKILIELLMKIECWSCYYSQVYSNSFFFLSRRKANVSMEIILTNANFYIYVGL